MAIYANYYTMDLFYAASENKSGTAIRFSDSGPEGNYYTCSLSVTDAGAKAATNNLGTGSASSYTYKGKYHFLGLGDSRKPITYTRPGGTYSKSLRAGSYGNYARVYPVEGVYITKSSAYVTYSNTTSTLILDGTDVSYSTTITPSSKRYIKSIVVKMCGVDVSSTSVTDNAILITKVTGDIDIAVETGTLSFKHRYKNDILIGTGTYKFRHYSVEGPITTETWIINESFDESDKSGDIKVSFTSGGTKFGQMSIGGSSTKYYGLIYCYLKSDGTWQTFFPIQNGWTVEKYRTVTFDEPVTDSTLLAWLQTNAVKQ